MFRKSNKGPTFTSAKGAKETSLTCVRCCSAPAWLSENKTWTLGAHSPARVATQSQTHAQGVVEHREALGPRRMSEKASRLVLCTEEPKGLPEREVMSKRAGTRNCRRGQRGRGEEAAAQSQPRASWRRAAEWILEREAGRRCGPCSNLNFILSKGDSCVSAFAV